MAPFSCYYRLRLHSDGKFRVEHQPLKRRSASSLLIAVALHPPSLLFFPFKLFCPGGHTEGSVCSAIEQRPETEEAKSRSPPDSTASFMHAAIPRLFPLLPSSCPSICSLELSRGRCRFPSFVSFLSRVRCSSLIFFSQARSGAKELVSPDWAWPD